MTYSIDDFVTPINPSVSEIAKNARAKILYGIYDDGTGQPVAVPVAVDENGVIQTSAGGGGGGGTSATILSLQTSATGANYVAFGDQACTSIDLINLTGTAIEYRRNGTGNAFPIPTNSSRRIPGITNANQISIRRVDNSNTQVTVVAEALS